MASEMPRGAWRMTTCTIGRPPGSATGPTAVSVPSRISSLKTNSWGSGELYCYCYYRCCACARLFVCGSSGTHCCKTRRETGKKKKKGRKEQKQKQKQKHIAQKRREKKKKRRRKKKKKNFNHGFSEIKLSPKGCWQSQSLAIRDPFFLTVVLVLIVLLLLSYHDTITHRNTRIIWATRNASSTATDCMRASVADTYTRWRRFHNRDTRVRTISLQRNCS